MSQPLPTHRRLPMNVLLFLIRLSPSDMLALCFAAALKRCLAARARALAAQVQVPCQIDAWLRRRACAAAAHSARDGQWGSAGKAASIEGFALHCQDHAGIGHGRRTGALRAAVAAGARALPPGTAIPSSKISAARVPSPPPAPAPAPAPAPHPCRTIPLRGKGAASSRVRPAAGRIRPCAWEASLSFTVLLY